MGNVAIFNGQYAKLLTPFLKFKDFARILTGTDDPTSVAQDAEKGSLYLRQTPSGAGQAFFKLDNGSTTNWFSLGGIFGESSDITTRLQDTFEDSIFQQLTAIDFKLDEDGHIDSGDGTYDSINKKYTFSGAAEEFLTTNLLSTPEFITPSKILGKINVVVFWKEGEIDDAATYEVSIDNFAVDVNEVAMERVGSESDAFVGSFTYEETTATPSLQLKITSSQASSIAGYGLFYEVEGQVASGIKLVKQFTFLSNTDNLDTFDLGWVADTDLLFVFHIQTGQIYHYPAFTQSGTSIVFPANTFLQASDENVTLFAIQAQGSSFDNSDANAALLADNGLGSLDGSIDKSVAGKGWKQRTPNGTLVELRVNDAFEIEVYEVTP